MKFASLFSTLWEDIRIRSHNIVQANILIKQIVLKIDNSFSFMGRGYFKQVHFVINVTVCNEIDKYRNNCDKFVAFCN